MIKINNINTNLLKRKLKLTILTTTLIIGITGCRNKQPQTYTTTNGDVNVTNEITNYVINNVTEYNAVKNENNTVINENTYNESNNVTNNEVKQEPIVVQPKEEVKQEPIVVQPKEESSNDVKALEYFKNKLNDLQESVEKEDNESAISKGQRLVETYGEFINGDISINGIDFKSLKREVQQQFREDKETIQELVDALINKVHANSDDNTSTFKDELSESISETWNQDMENLYYLKGVLGDLFNQGKQKIKGND